VNWSGSTGLGWDHYDRAHAATAPPAEQEIRITTGESKARIDVVAYEDEAVGLMPEDEEPMRVTEITLRPRITVTGDASEERVRKLVHTAHEHCYIANSLNSAMTIEPAVERR
jgi:organic hydroperoxide reductase OsmC/OhrA